MKAMKKYLLYGVVLVALCAAASRTPVAYKLVIFEGLDWCPDCQRLQRNVLSDSAFNAYLKRAQIALERIDFPRRTQLSDMRKAYNEQMAKKYGFTGGYPSLFIASESDSIIQRIDYTNESAQGMITKIQEALKKQKQSNEARGD